MRRRLWSCSLALLMVLSGLIGGSALASTTTQAGTDFPNSIFARSVVGQPVTPSSAKLVANLVAQYQSRFGSVGVNSMPVFVVPWYQKRVWVSREFGCGNFEASTGTVPIPPGAYTSGPGDRELVVYQPSTHSVWELWRASPTLFGNWSACWGGRLDASTSSGVFAFPYGMSASGISYLATMITEADVQSGAINHALAIQVPSCDRWTVPAVRGDCPPTASEVSEGSWLRLPANLPMPTGLTPLGRMVFKALQTYGAVVTDRAGAVMIMAESARDWAFTGHSGPAPITVASLGEPEYEVLDGIPWPDLQVVQPPGGAG